MRRPLNSLFGMGLLACVTAFSQSRVSQPHVEVELISSVKRAQPGRAFPVALSFKLDKGWHVYWKNPGDSGLAPKVNWLLPQGASASPLQFPVPERIPLPSLVNFGYADEIWFLSDIDPGVENRNDLSVKAEAKWLVCKEECIPGQAELEVVLPVAGTEERSSRFNDFERARSRLPKSADAGIRVEETLAADKAVLRISTDVEDAFFFFEKTTVLEPSGKQTVRKMDSGIELTLSRSQQADWTPVKGVLKLGQSGVEYTLAAGRTPTRSGIMGMRSLLLMCLFAVLGGLILNLMPCVLPVLSIKVFGLIEQSGQNPRQIRKHGLAFTAGVLVSFWALTALLYGLKAGGSELGWGFQLQSPGFVSFLVALFFFLGLSLLGVFEIGGNWIGVGSKLASQEGYGGSFFTGVLTTIAATPCSAPFMGTAVGFALAQPFYVGGLVLTFLGIGLSLPYLAFSFIPGASKLLPRPGRWMEIGKQVLAFPLFLTVLWLLSVLHSQQGMDAVLRVLTAILVGYFGIWFYKQFATPRMAAKAIAALLALGALSILFVRIHAEPSAAAWKPFRPSDVAEARKRNVPVFIDFTAEWCVTCKVNERLVLDNASVHDGFQKYQVALFKADWTNSDPVITQELARFGRNSVPLYVLYLPGKDEPQILPQVLTPALVLDRIAASMTNKP